MSRNRDYYNAMLQGCHYKQMVEEACNGDLENNHFRKTLTVEDCNFSFEAAKMWTRHALGLISTKSGVIH